MTFATALCEPVTITQIVNDVCDLHLKSKKGNVDLLPNILFELLLLTTNNKLALKQFSDV